MSVNSVSIESERPLHPAPPLLRTAAAPGYELEGRLGE
jgi:hypothetical protein